MDKQILRTAWHHFQLIAIVLPTCPSFDFPLFWLDSNSYESEIKFQTSFPYFLRFFDLMFIGRDFHQSRLLAPPTSTHSLLPVSHLSGCLREALNKLRPGPWRDLSVSACPQSGLPASSRLGCSALGKAETVGRICGFQVVESLILESSLELITYCGYTSEFHLLI